MKTKLLLTASLAMMIAVGCTEQRIIDDNNQRAVVFKSFVNRPDRGIDLSELTNVDFGLWAYQGIQGIANGQNFAVASNAQILNGGAGGFADPNQTIYWPSNGELMGFYAYAPFGAVTNPSPTDVGIDALDDPTFDFSVNPNVPDQVDLLVARAESLTPTPTVALTFRHALTKLGVMARTTVVNWRVAITGIQVENVAYEGKYNIALQPTQGSYQGWTANVDDVAAYDAPLAINGSSIPNISQANDAVVITTDTYSPVLSSQEGASLFLMPHNLRPDARLVVSYTLYNNVSGAEIMGLQSVNVPISGIWNGGQIITYRLSFDAKASGEAGSEIKFTTSVVGWDQELGNSTNP